jgi:oxepin-CoA hydrolase/3-oxo-5,6-dehydrosuberyl-CoA semialdehyde dehydrogenase
MTNPTTLKSYVQGAWHGGTGPTATLVNATTEAPLAVCSTGGVDFAGVLRHAREVGGPALRAMTFVERAQMLKDLSAAIHEHREALIDLSIANAGTTRGDAKFDIDGATGTLAAYGYFGKELGDRPFLVDGEGVQLGRTARFWGRHVLVPRHGAAIHINAFNFPAWNMFEKAACALLAGVPVVEKPGTATALVAWKMAEIAVESGVLPEGAFQFLAGSAGDLLDHVGPQDSLAFTGSSGTGVKLRSNPAVVRHGVQVNIEADSLNAAVLGPDVEPGSDTWNLFVRYITLDVRQKTGQKCTAVRRILAPADRLAEVRDAIVAELARVVTGDPADKDTTMGPLASAAQLKDVRAGIGQLAAAAEVVHGGAEPIAERGFFVSPTLLVAADADGAVLHDLEVFGPCATLLPYDGSAARAAELVGRGQGGLVSSVYANDTAWTEEVVLGLAPWHGRIWIGADKVAEQALPPGTVLPASIHGGPGRAGGGEELGALRGLSLYMQRVALQGYKGFVENTFGS